MARKQAEETTQEDFVGGNGGSDIPEFHRTVGGEPIEKEDKASDDAGENLESKSPEVKEDKEESVKEDIVESYTPDFSYSVLDQKKEFPEWVRQAIKDKKAEDELRDLYTKAEGLAPVKEKFEGLSKKHQEFESKHNQMVERLGELQFYLDKGHYDHFFKQVGIPQNKVVEYVASLLREQDMTPEQRAQVQQFREQEIASYQQQKSYSALENQNRQLLINQHQLSMERAMSMPEARKVADYVDQVQGAGSFRESVNTYGRAYYAQHGHDLPATDAVAHVMKQYQAFLPSGGVSESNDLISAKAELKSGRPGGVIPNVGKKASGSPVRKAIRSIEDIEKIRKQKYG